MSRRRIPMFTARLETICDEAGLPRHDATDYDPASGMLVFLWHDPEFCLGAPLRSASIFGLTAEGLRDAWIRKFGTAPS